MNPRIYLVQTFRYEYFANASGFDILDILSARPPEGVGVRSCCADGKPQSKRGMEPYA